MSTKEVDHKNQITIGPEVDGALLDKVTKFQKEIDERNTSNVNVTGKTEEGGENNTDEPAPNGVDNGDGANRDLPHNNDDSAPAAGTGADGGGKTIPEVEAPKGGIPVDDFLKTNDTNKQALLDQLLGDPDTNLTIKNKRGKEVKTNFNDLKADIARGRQSQAQLDKINGSAEMEFGVIMAAAKAGDKEAQKKALILLKEFAGKDDIDAFVDDVEEVKGDFDAGAAKEKQESDAAWGEYFPEELKNSVDYEENLGNMDSVLKGQIPGKVYDFYMNRPETKRIMYELVAQGVAQEALDAFFEKYDSLPSVEQTRMDMDPAAWGTAFNASFESLKRQKAKSASKNAESNNPSEPMDSVSSGSGGRTRAPAPAKSFMKMSSKEFAAEKKRLIAENG